VYRQKVKVALEQKIANNLPYNINGEPVLLLKNGVQLIIHSICGKWFVNRDYGLTYEELARDIDFDEVVDVVIEQSKI